MRAGVPSLPGCDTFFDHAQSATTGGITQNVTALRRPAAVVTTQLAQTLLTRRHSPLVLGTALGSAGVLVAIVQTPGVSHFFGCTPLGPVAWSGVISATAGATVVSVLAPNWLARRVAAIEPKAAEIAARIPGVWDGGPKPE